MQVVTYSERPDLADRVDEIADPFPTFVHEDPVCTRYWPLMRERFPELQVVLYDDEQDEIVGRGQAVPATAMERLPGGVDDLLETRFARADPPEPDCVSAVVAVVDPRRQGHGFSATVVGGMRDAAAAAGFDTLIAPVRPTRKADFPLIAIERYVSWTRADRLPFDPWIRLHARLGAELLEVCPRSMVVPGSREEWEAWTGLEFPGDGDYVVPGALVPVRFEGGRGTYVEPNVWMRHRVSR